MHCAPIAVIHPHTELRFVDADTGLGVFATQPIVKGTITWVLDPLDQIIDPRFVDHLPERCQNVLDTYAYPNGEGQLVLCWDHGRFVNHGCAPNALCPGWDFEIAVRDIEPGEEIRTDYGSLNLDLPFECHCRAHSCRTTVRPEDFETLHPLWDSQIREAFVHLPHVHQPLWDLVREREAALDGARDPATIPTILRHRHVPQPRRSHRQRMRA